MERATKKDENGYYLSGDGIWSDRGTPEKFRGEYVDRFAAFEDAGIDLEDLDRVKEIMDADREGRVRIARVPPSKDRCCGNCVRFCRITGTRSGSCSLRGRGEQIPFRTFQSRKACKEFQRRTEEHG